jgi:hypothetical protein
VPLSLWHIGVMVGLRKLCYALEGSHYLFFDKVSNPLLYEYRKDLASYLQFAGFAAIAHWLLARAAIPASPPEAPRILKVADGAVTHQVPVDEIDHVNAAGNYVELAWAGRTLLHRATLAAVAAELGQAFVQIHRRCPFVPGATSRAARAARSWSATSPSAAMRRSPCRR